MDTTVTSGTTASAVSLFRRLIDEGFNHGDLTVIDEIVAPGFVEHQRGMSGGIEGVKQTISFLRAAHPDLVLTIDDLAISGDTVWARLHCTGTHTGPFFGMEATGKTFTIDVIDICRAGDGKLVEHWGVPDRFGLLEQLGLFAAPSKRPAHE